MKPHQLSGGGNGTSCLLLNSCGIPFEPGASVGFGEKPAVATRPIGVGIGPAHGMAPGIARAMGSNNENAKKVAIEGAIVLAQSIVGGLLEGTVDVERKEMSPSPKIIPSSLGRPQPCLDPSRIALAVLVHCIYPNRATWAQHVHD